MDTYILYIIYYENRVFPENKYNRQIFDENKNISM